MNDAKAMPSIWFEQLQHPRIVGPRLGGKKPRDHRWKVVIAEWDRVMISEPVTCDHRRGPWAHTGEILYLAHELLGLERREATNALGSGGETQQCLRPLALEAERGEVGCREREPLL